LAEAKLDGNVQVVEHRRKRFATVPPGPWSDPPNTAVVVPDDSGLLMTTLTLGICSSEFLVTEVLQS
jgi:hypothetical protein